MQYLTFEDPLLTNKEVGQILWLGHSKVYELISDGELLSLKIGRARRVMTSEVKKFICRVSTNPADECRNQGQIYRPHGASSKKGVR